MTAIEKRNKMHLLNYNGLNCFGSLKIQSHERLTFYSYSQNVFSIDVEICEIFLKFNISFFRRVEKMHRKRIG